jgi:Sulfotransferase family
MKYRFDRYPIIFTHIPRSGGTTLVSIMARQYRSSEQFSFYVRQKAGNIDDSVAAFSQLPEERRMRLKLLQGHVSYGIHEQYDTYAYTTLIRDPVERIVSYYYYILKRPEHYLHSIVIRDRMRLEQFVASELTSELDNAQTRQISGGPNVPYGKCSAVMLNTAKLNLIRSYDVFGITELFDESVMMMARHFGWSYPFYIKQNVIKERPLKARIPSSTIELIEQRNPLDLELYRFANSKFTELLSQQDQSFKEELEKFKRYNELMRRLDNSFGGKFDVALKYLYAKFRRQ